jgi:hypothetical protein
LDEVVYERPKLKVCVPPLILNVSRRRIIRQFERARAFGLAMAIASPSSSPFSGLWRPRLAAAGVLLRVTMAASGWTQAWLRRAQ